MLAITRTIDDLGRIVIPKEIRHGSNLNTGDAVIISLDDNNHITIEPYVVEKCTMCGNTINVQEYSDNRYICNNCVDNIKNKF